MSRWWESSHKHKQVTPPLTRPLFMRPPLHAYQFSWPRSPGLSDDPGAPSRSDLTPAFLTHLSPFQFPSRASTRLPRPLLPITSLLSCPLPSTLPRHPHLLPRPCPPLATPPLPSSFPLPLPLSDGALTISCRHNVRRAHSHALERMRQAHRLAGAKWQHLQHAVQRGYQGRAASQALLQAWAQLIEDDVISH